MSRAFTDDTISDTTFKTFRTTSSFFSSLRARAITELDNSLRIINHYPPIFSSVKKYKIEENIDGVEYRLLQLMRLGSAASLKDVEEMEVIDDLMQIAKEWKTGNYALSRRINHKSIFKSPRRQRATRFIHGQVMPTDRRNVDQFRLL